MQQLLIAMELTENDAAKIRLIAEAGVFGIDTGSATLHFTKGKLKSVKTEIFTYATLQKDEVVHT